MWAKVQPPYSSSSYCSYSSGEKEGNVSVSKRWSFYILIFSSSSWSHQVDVHSFPNVGKGVTQTTLNTRTEFSGGGTRSNSFSLIRKRKQTQKKGALLLWFLGVLHMTACCVIVAKMKGHKSSSLFPGHLIKWHYSSKCYLVAKYILMENYFK